MHPLLQLIVALLSLIGTVEVPTLEPPPPLVVEQESALVAPDQGHTLNPANPTTTPPTVSTTWTLRHDCPTEDSTNCWFQGDYLACPTNPRATHIDQCHPPLESTTIPPTTLRQASTTLPDLTSSTTTEPHHPPTTVLVSTNPTNP